MAVISIGSLIILTFVIISLSKKTKEEESNGNSNGNWKKIGMTLLFFIPFFVGYYMLIAMLICIPLGFTAEADWGAWAYGIIGGMTIAPILTIVTIYKVVWRK